MNKIKELVLVAFALVFLNTAEVSALSLNIRPSFNLGNLGNTSWDPPGYNIVGKILPYTNGNVYSVGSFFGDDTTWNFRLVAEVSGYKGVNASIIYSTQNIMLFDGAQDIGSSTDINFGSSNFFNLFAIKNPGGSYFSDDHSNPFNGPNLLAFIITTAATITYPDVNLSDASQSISLLVGDVILAFEDLPLSFDGTTGTCYVSDCDWNDKVIVARQNVPEPATLLLLGSGILGVYRSKKKLLN